jgi:hypothetical protein
VAESDQAEEQKGGDAEAQEQQGSHSEAADRDKAKDEMRELEKDPPENLEDWPEGAAKYETFGGPEGEHGYHEGPEEKLGPSSLRHHEDGSVEIAGDKVDDPDEYKGDPIPGGPTDPDAPQDLTTERIRGGTAGSDDESDGGEDKSDGEDESAREDE